MIISGKILQRKCKTNIKGEILQQWINNRACHRSVCLFARDCFTWTTLLVQMLTGQWQDQRSALCISASVSPTHRSYFQPWTKLKTDTTVAAVSMLRFITRNNCGATKWHFRCLMFEYHLLTGPVVAFSARLGTAGWPLQAHSSPPLIPGLTQCIPVEGISRAFFEIFVHL